MVQDEVMHTVTQIIREELQSDDLILTSATDLSQTEGWDSVTGSCVMIAIEHEFGFEFDGNVLDHLTTVGSIVEMVKRNQSAGTANA